jgi:hypothetical protein
VTTPKEDTVFRKRHIDTYDPAPGLTEARRRFGGYDLPAAIAGMLAGLGTGVLLAGLAAAIGDVGSQRDTGDTVVSTSALATGLAVLLVSFLVGGWVAGRMARYDGVLNGMLSALLFVAVAAGLGALGHWLDAKYDFLGSVNLPSWFDGPSDWTRATWAAIGIVVVVVAAGIGGALGTSYHRRADRVIAVEPGLAPIETERLVTGDADVDLERTEKVPRHARH